jgi:hypothetical protein
MRNSAVTREMACILDQTPWATERMVEAARRGAPGGLVVAFRNPDRPVIVDWLLSEGRVASARLALGAVWDHDHHHCLQRWGLKGTISRLEETRRGETTELPFLPPVVDIWRGCVAESPSPMLRLSWTLDRRVAAFFCFRHARGWEEQPAHGLILHRRIRRGSILMHLDERAEAEVLVKPNRHFDHEVVDWPRLEAMKADWKSSLSDHAGIYPPLDAAA